MDTRDSKMTRNSVDSGSLPKAKWIPSRVSLLPMLLLMHLVGCHSASDGGFGLLAGYELRNGNFVKTFHSFLAENASISGADFVKFDPIDDKFAGNYVTMQHHFPHVLKKVQAAYLDIYYIGDLTIQDLEDECNSKTCCNHPLRYIAHEHVEGPKGIPQFLPLDTKDGEILSSPLSHYVWWRKIIKAILSKFKNFKRVDYFLTLSVQTSLAIMTDGKEKGLTTKAGEAGKLPMHLLQSDVGPLLVSDLRNCQRRLPYCDVCLFHKHLNENATIALSKDEIIVDDDVELHKHLELTPAGEEQFKVLLNEMRGKPGLHDIVQDLTAADTDDDVWVKAQALWRAYKNPSHSILRVYLGDAKDLQPGIANLKLRK